MTSQLVMFRAFLFIFISPPPPPTLGLKKNSRKSTNKKSLAWLKQINLYQRDPPFKGVKQSTRTDRLFNMTFTHW